MKQWFRNAESSGIEAPKVIITGLVPLAAGTKLVPYEIQSPLGVGGMGEVYRARDTQLDRTVAVKILPEHLAKTPEPKPRFEREARAVSSLIHAHICALFDVGSQDGLEYLVMEYPERETLAERLAKGPLKIENDRIYHLIVISQGETSHETKRFSEKRDARRWSKCCCGFRDGAAQPTCARQGQGKAYWEDCARRTLHGA